MDLFAMLTTNQLPCEECARTLLMQTMGSEPSFVLTSFTKWAIGTPPSLTSWATLLSSTKQQTDSMDKGGICTTSRRPAPSPRTRGSAHAARLPTPAMVANLRRRRKHIRAKCARSTLNNRTRVGCHCVAVGRGAWSNAEARMLHAHVEVGSSSSPRESAQTLPTRGRD